MTEQEFHRQRRMIAVVHESVMIARKGDTYSHHEWLREFGIDHLEHPRGYVLGDRLMLYQGSSFDKPVSPFEIARAVLEFFPDVKEVGFGVKPGETWEPQLLYTRDKI